MVQLDSSSPAEIAFVGRFNNEFRLAENAGEQDEIIRKYCEEFSTEHDELLDDLAAIMKVAALFNRNIHGTSWSKFKHLFKAAEPRMTKYSAKQKLCAKTLTALWGEEIVRHYEWDQAAPKYLAKLVTIAETIHQWSAFVDTVNLAMIKRHEESLGDALIHSIGTHHVKAHLPTHSPLSHKDLDMVISKEGTDEELQSRIDAWLDPCQCLSVSGHRIPDAQYAKFAIQKDKYGMLIAGPNPCPERSQVCEQCRNSHGRRQTAGLRLPPSGSNMAGSRKRSRHTPPDDSDEESDSMDDEFPPANRMPQPTPPHDSDEDMNDDVPSFPCTRCGEKCGLCDVPEGTTESEWHHMQETAHHIAQLPCLADQLDSILPIQFAATRSRSSNSEPDVEITGLADFSRDAKLTTRRILRPLIIRETFQDAKDYGPETFFAQLSNTYSGTTTPFRNGDALEATGNAWTDVAKRLQGEADSTLPRKTMRFSDILNAIKPKLTRIPRFTLYRRLIKRGKAKSHDTFQDDLEESLSFNAFSYAGTYGCTYAKQLGGIWLRCLSGQQLLWCTATPSPGQEQQTEARAVLIRSGDLIVIPAGSCKAELALETTIMDGGIFWDEHDLGSLMKFLRDSGEGSTEQSRFRYDRSMLLELVDLLSSGSGPWMQEDRDSFSSELLEIHSLFMNTQC